MMSLLSPLRAAGRRALLVLLALGLVLPAGALVPDDASAVIVCQHKKRKKMVRLERGPNCRNKKRWRQVADLDEFALTSTVNNLTVLLNTQVGILCMEDSSRTFVARAVSGSTSARTDGCRQFDGDQSACDGAFQVTSGDPTSCWYYAGKCLPCRSSHQMQSACINTCQPPTCPQTTGRQYTGRCQRFSNPTTCGQHFRLNFAGAEAPETCWWDTPWQTCMPCSPRDQSMGFCANACLPPVTCDSLAGPNYCGDAQSQSECTSWFQLSSQQIPLSCHWTGTSCIPCTVHRQFDHGECSNSCG